MMIYKPQVYDAWLASGELPSEWLITLLHEMKNSGNAYEAFAAGNESVRNLIPKNRRDALASAAGKQEMNTFCSLMEGSQENRKGTERCRRSDCKRTGERN